MPNLDDQLRQTVMRVARHERATRRVEALTARIAEARPRLAELFDLQKKEEKDLLEAAQGGLFGFVTALLAGDREDRMAKERAEALAAVAATQAKLSEVEEMERALEQASAEQAKLADSHARLAALLTAKRERLTDPTAAARCAELDTERAIAAKTKTEIEEALEASTHALDVLNGWVQSIELTKSRLLRPEVTFGHHQERSLRARRAAHLEATNVRAEEVQLALHRLRRELADVAQTLPRDMVAEVLTYSPILSMLGERLAEHDVGSRLLDTQSGASDTLARVKSVADKLRDDLAECEAWQARIDREELTLLA